MGTEQGERKVNHQTFGCEQSSIAPAFIVGVCIVLGLIVVILAILR
jgi:hypothetical protein